MPPAAPRTERASPPPSTEPDPAAPFTLFGRELGAGAWAAALTIALLVLVLRRFDGVRHPKLFAEDGPIFLTDAYLRSWPSSVFRPYAGYLHVLLRIWAELTTLLPVRLLALSYTAFALGTTVVCYALVLSRRLRWLIPDDGLRVAAFVALVLLPGASEILGNLTNTIWPLGVALVLISLSGTPRTPAGRNGELGAVLALALTGPTSMLVWPAFLLRWRRQPTAHDRAVALLAVGCAMVQGLIVVFSDQRTGSGLDLSEPGDIARTLLVRIWGTLALGERMLVGTLPERTPAVVWVLCAVAVTVTVLALVVVPASFRLSVVLTFVLTCGATVWAFDGRLFRLGHSVDAGRYFVIPTVLLLLAWMAMVARLSRKGTPLGRVVAAAPVAMLAFAAAQDFVLPRQDPIHWGKTAACIAEHQVCQVPINPPGFSFDLPPVPGAR